jgi:hypothetical protein
MIHNGVARTAVAPDVKPDRVGGPPKAFLRALDRIGEPLVRGLVAMGVTFPLFSRMMKRMFIRVAVKETQSAGAPLTVSRISVMTGLQRKDIGQIRAQIERRREPPANISLGARLIGIWNGAKRFTDAAGRPLPLPRFSGARPTFEDLVRTVSSDVRPKAVLDEWLRLGVVAVDEADRVHLKADAFVPRRGFDELAYYYGRNLGDHLATSTHNLIGAGEPLLEQAVYYDKLTPASVAELARIAREIGVDALRRINREALRLADADAGKPEANQRMSAGLYYYAGPDTADDSAAGEVGDDRT